MSWSVIKGPASCIFFSIIIIFFSCAKETGSSDILYSFYQLKKTKNFDEMIQYYSSGTLKAIESAVNKGLISENSKLLFFPVFDIKTEWKILMKEVNVNRGRVRLKFIKHSKENLVGLDMIFNLKRENGIWKIDMENDIKELIGRSTRGGEEEYIREKSGLY